MPRLIRAVLRYVVIRLAGWSERLTHWLEDLEWELEESGPHHRDRGRRSRIDARYGCAPPFSVMQVGSEVIKWDGKRLYRP